MTLRLCRLVNKGSQSLFNICTRPSYWGGRVFKGNETRRLGDVFEKLAGRAQDEAACRPGFAGGKWIMNLAHGTERKTGVWSKDVDFKRNVRSSLPTLNSSLFESRTEWICLNVGFIQKTRHTAVSVFPRRFYNNSWFYCRDTDIQSSSARSLCCLTIYPIKKKKASERKSRGSLQKARLIIKLARCLISVMRERKWKSERKEKRDGVFCSAFRPTRSSCFAYWHSGALFKHSLASHGTSSPASSTKASLTGHGFHLHRAQRTCRGALIRTGGTEWYRASIVLCLALNTEHAGHKAGEI